MQVLAQITSLSHNLISAVEIVLRTPLIAEHLLERTLDHVAAGVLGAHGRRQPALALVQDVPLITLHGADLGDEAGPWVGGLVNCRREIDVRLPALFGWRPLVVFAK